MVFQGVALSGLGEAEGVLVPDVFVVRVGDGQDDFDGMGAGPEGIFLGGQTLAVSGISDDDTGQARELAGIGIGIGLAGRGIAGVVREFDSQQGGLKWIEAKVAPDLEVKIFRTAAVGAQEAGLISECVVLGDEHAAIAETAEVFGWEEGKSTKIADGATGLIFVAGADRLGAVLDDTQTVSAGEGHHAIHVGGLAEEVDGDDGFSLRGYFTGGLCGIDIEADGAGIDEHGSSAGTGDTSGGGEEREGGDQYFVPGADAEGHQGEDEGVGAAGDADGMGGAHHGGNFFFEGGDLRALNEHT